MDDSDRLSALRRELRDQLGDQRFEVWLGGPAELRIENRALHVGCPSATEMEWLRRRLHATLERCCRKIMGPGAPIVYAVVARANDAKPKKSVAPSRQSAAAATPARSVRRRNCDRWTFESLAVGTANRLAVATVQSAVEQPGRFTPLLVYGGHGVGKSHLLQAAVSRMRQSASRPTTLHLSAEQFTCQFLAEMHERTLPSFRQKFRTVDALLIDDVHFLVGKKSTLEELLSTIDAVHGRGGQVMLTADRAPGEFPAAASALTAKLAGGVAIALDPPDYSMRREIVRAIARRVSVQLPPGVEELTARRVVGSARLLAGAINRLVAASMAADRPITEELAATTLADFTQQHTPQVKLADVQRAVCEAFGVEASSLKSSRKTRGLVEPRMIAMWLARRYTRAALSEIGAYFGRRSHSTVVSAQKKCDRLLSENSNVTVGDVSCPIDDAVRRVETLLRTA